MQNYETIEQKIADNDVSSLRESIGNICYIDRDFSSGEFDEVLRYVESKGIKLKDDTLDGKLISDGKMAYTDEDFARAVFMLKKNFCNERIADVKKIGKALYKKTAPVSVKSSQTGTNPKKAQSHREESNLGQILPVAIGAAIILIAIIVLLIVFLQSQKIVLLSEAMKMSGVVFTAVTENIKDTASNAVI